jgi:hypothetical protein
MTRMYDDGTHVAVAHRQTNDISVIRLDGMSWTFRRRAFGSFRRTAGGWQLPVEEEFNFVLRGHETLIRDVQEKLSLAGEVPLMEILQRLGVAERLYSPHALQDGLLVVKQELKRYWTATGVSAWAKYAEPVPDEIHGLWERCATELGCLPAK